MAPGMRRVLIIGGSFAGLSCARDLKDHYMVTIVDCKEFFEYTPGVLRAYVKPKHLDALTFTLFPVIESRMHCKFIWGEVTKLDGPERLATIKPMFTDAEETLDFDYCIIAAGCNFGPFHKWGESLWFPTIHAAARPEGSWPHLDERFLEGRRRHILEEYADIQKLNDKGASILVVGAGFIGVEWITELEHFFPKLKLTIIDALPKCLGPLPDNAANYCSKYMKKHGIAEFYDTKFNAGDQAFWDKIKIPNKPDKQYVCIGVKASNYFMPKETLSEKGPGGGGWILMDQQLAVKTRDVKVWAADEQGYFRVWAIGDCNFGCVEKPGAGAGGETMVSWGDDDLTEVPVLQGSEQQHDPLAPGASSRLWSGLRGMGDISVAVNGSTVHMGGEITGIVQSLAVDDRVVVKTTLALGELERQVPINTKGIILEIDDEEQDFLVRFEGFGTEYVPFGKAHQLQVAVPS